MEEKLKECVCIKSEKVRIDSDDYAWCEKCERSISAASKKRVIKNRNDPKF
jgi:RNA polymerase-binding transcription factor DksA